MKIRTLFVRFMERVGTAIRFELIGETEVIAPSFEAAYTQVVGNHTNVPTHVLFQDKADKKAIAGFGLKEKTTIDMNRWQIKVVTPPKPTITKKFPVGDNRIWCQASSCSELVVPEIGYCENHGCPIHGEEFTNFDGLMACASCYGDKATEVPPGNDDPTTPTTGKRQCLGITKKGQPCQGGPKVGTDYCGPHTTEEAVYNTDMDTEFVMLTGHGELTADEDEDTIEDSLVAYLLELKTGRNLAGISGGCKGGDYLMAKACVRAEVPFKLVLPNCHYWAKYQTPGQDFMRDNATEIIYTVDRPNVQDWKARWGAERWYMDNFARNQHMVKLSDHYIALSRNHPTDVLAIRNWKDNGYIRGGTADGIRQIADHGKTIDGHVNMVWMTPSDGATNMMSVTKHAAV